MRPQRADSLLATLMARGCTYSKAPLLSSFPSAMIVDLGIATGLGNNDRADSSLRRQDHASRLDHSPLSQAIIMF